jgi:RNA polymerase sigma-70 factor (ECF subfamily)
VALRRIARGWAGRAGEHDDLYQEILYQLWSTFPSFRGESAADTWLYRVALYTAPSLSPKTPSCVTSSTTWARSIAP